MAAVLATVTAPHAPEAPSRVRLVVSTTGMNVGCPWTVDLDGRHVGFFDDRRSALAFVAMLERSMTSHVRS